MTMKSRIEKTDEGGVADAVENRNGARPDAVTQKKKRLKKKKKKMKREVGR